MLKMKSVWQDGVVDWTPTVQCDECKEEIRGGVGASGVYAWEVTAVGAILEDGSLSTPAYEVVTGETFHLHTWCLLSWVEPRGGVDRWIARDIRSLPRATANALGVLELGDVSEAGWWE